MPAPGSVLPHVAAHPMSKADDAAPALPAGRTNERAGGGSRQPIEARASLRVPGPFLGDDHFECLFGGTGRKGP